MITHLLAPGVRNYWSRKEWTTRCADPTVVVSWTYRKDTLCVVITEFQNVYTVTKNGESFDDEDSIVNAKLTHCDLESVWQDRQQDLIDEWRDESRD